MRSTPSALLLPLLLSAAPAFAASSDWIEAGGGRVRLVTAGLPDGAGRLQGALEIELAPGWKTYWRDPGDSGVPPAIDPAASSNIRLAALRFPPPERIEDGGSSLTGYRYPVALPVTLSLKSGADPIAASVFLGICEKICIPVQGVLSLDPSDGAEDPADAAVVKAAFDALPGHAQSGFAVTVVESTADRLVLEAEVPGGAEEAELFLAGEDGYVFGPPQHDVLSVPSRFTVPILARPDAKPEGRGVAYTLSGPTGAVEGLIPYP